MATMIPQDLSFADTAPVVFERVAIVEATPAELWEILADHERWPRWFTSVKRCEPTSEPARGVGSTRSVYLPGVRVDERFIAWDEPELWAFTGVAGPPVWRSLVERVALVELGPDRTQITYRMAIAPKRGFGLLTRAMGAGVAKALGDALANLPAEVARRRTEAAA